MNLPAAHQHSAESRRLRRAMRDLVALSTLPAIWAGADARRIPASLAEVLCSTLDLEVAYVNIRHPEPAEALRASASANASREEILAAMRKLAAADTVREFVEPGTGRVLRCAVARFGMGDVSGMVMAATARAEFPTEEDRVLLGMAGNHACMELYRRATERDLHAKTDALKVLAGEQEALLERETRRANLLGLVAEAGRELNSVLDPERICAILTEHARRIIGSHQAVTSLTTGSEWAQGDGPGNPLVGTTNRPMRAAQSLAVPLVGHGGRTLGQVQLSGKATGEFSEEDEAVLVQLAAIASSGIENARFYSELQQQDRRKDEFLATLAHELRNPLAPVRNGLALLERAGSLDATRDVRDMMTRQVSHMVHLIDDLLDVSRITTGKVQLRPEVVDVRSVIDAALEVSRPAIDRAGHTLAVSLPKGPLHVRVDPTRMAQVLSNLLNNAAKYTNPPGRIELTAQQDGGDAVLRVTDNGAGLEAQTIPGIFELFTQVGKDLHHSQGGLGIGLALVKKLVEMHGGGVDAESKGLGQGSTFTVRLPATIPAHQNVEPVVTRPAQRNERAWRILVVDDNTDAAETMATVLQMSGHTAKTSHSGPAALEEVPAFAPEIVLLDIGLPGMDGYEVARRIRSMPGCKEVMLVAVTGWGADKDRRQTQQAGFAEHLTKPVEFEQLESVLARLARSQASPVTAQAPQP
ncbi:MAG TPA: ATP-binding protein [Ramlibacter sp.]|nr:ATP-binding protein [Ramlibacter sp.]